MESSLVATTLGDVTEKRDVFLGDLLGWFRGDFLGVFLRFVISGHLVLVMLGNH